MTDVAAVKVVIKSNKKLESKARGRHKRRTGDLQDVSVVIDTVMEKLIQKSFSRKACLAVLFIMPTVFSSLAAKRLLRTQMLITVNSATN